MGMFNNKNDKQDEKIENPSQDHTGRFAVDQLLRKNGFRIRLRRKNSEPRWSKDGKLYTQSQALDTLSQEDVWNAEYAERLGDGFDVEGAA